MQPLAWLIVILICPWTVHARGLLKRVDLSVCAEDGSRCLSVKADSAKGSHIQDLYYMKNPVLSWKGQEVGKKFGSGYLDFENNRLVLREDGKKGNGEEMLIDLKTLRQTTFAVK